MYIIVGDEIGSYISHYYDQLDIDHNIERVNNPWNSS